MGNEGQYIADLTSLHGTYFLYGDERFILDDPLCFASANKAFWVDFI